MSIEDDYIRRFTAADQTIPDNGNADRGRDIYQPLPEDAALFYAEEYNPEDFQLSTQELKRVARLWRYGVKKTKMYRPLAVGVSVI